MLTFKGDENRYFRVIHPNARVLCQKYSTISRAQEAAENAIKIGEMDMCNILIVDNHGKAVKIAEWHSNKSGRNVESMKYDQTIMAYDEAGWYSVWSEVSR